VEERLASIATKPGEDEMHARVATFEGADSSELRKTIDAIRQESAQGPPEGVPATGFLLLSDEQGGKTLAVSLFATEEDMREGDKVLNEMQPPVTGGMGRRTSVEMYEVTVDVRV
jgi:hypothetical protein